MRFDFGYKIPGMPEQIALLRVPVVSPSDVKAERNVLQEVLEEVNRDSAHERAFTCTFNCTSGSISGGIVNEGLHHSSF